MDKVQCPMCASQNTEMISTYTSDNYIFYLCMRCDGIFAHPMKSGGKKWYATSEWYAIPAEVSEDLRWYEMFFLKEHTPCNDKRVLNIGCGKNIFLRRLKELGCSVTAVDINEKIIDFTKNVLGIENAYTSEVLDFIRNCKGKKFDVVVFFEVLEHLENPGEFIRGLKNILEENGIIVLSVPNRERILPSKDIWDYPPHHLTRWNTKSLKNFLEINGYKLEKVSISPITADSFVKLLKSNFNTWSIEEKIKQADDKKSDQRIMIAFMFEMLFKLRMLLYKIIEIIMRIFLKTEGLNIYAVARIKNK